MPASVGALLDENGDEARPLAETVREVELLRIGADQLRRSSRQFVDALQPELAQVVADGRHSCRRWLEPVILGRRHVHRHSGDPSGAAYSPVAPWAHGRKAQLASNRRGPGRRVASMRPKSLPARSAVSVVAGFLPRRPRAGVRWRRSAARPPYGNAVLVEDLQARADAGASPILRTSIGCMAEPFHYAVEFPMSQTCGWQLTGGVGDAVVPESASPKTLLAMRRKASVRRGLPRWGREWRRVSFQAVRRRVSSTASRRAVATVLFMAFAEDFPGKRLKTNGLA